MNQNLPILPNPGKEIYIKFFAPVSGQSTNTLLRVVDQKYLEGYKRIHLLISSPGGSVHHGLSVYNNLKGLPMEIYTYNFGSVDSIGVVMYCAGTRRFSVPHSRFLIHNVSITMSGINNLDEKQIEQHLKSLKIDHSNIAKVISHTCGHADIDVENEMNNRTTLNPTEAVGYGLVHEIKTELFPPNAELISIGEQFHNPNHIQIAQPFQLMQ